jgi:hypothetical protein
MEEPQEFYRAPDPFPASRFGIKAPSTLNCR